MNAEVTLFPSVHPWSKTPNTTCLNLSDSSAPAFPALNSTRPSGDNMSSEPLDSQHLEAQLDFFHKLGYSTAQVQAVQQKFGPSMDTDKVLGELVRIGPSPEPKPVPATMISVLVPRGPDVPASGPSLQLPVTESPPQSREESGEDEDALRPIVIDGSNVAMSHGNKEVFSCLGIQLAVNFFLDRGHTEITVFVPSWRKEQPRPDVPITDQHILRDLEKKKILVFTPSRHIARKRVVCNDDCYIVKLAFQSDGIVVSNDMYRDLQGGKPEWKRFIEERLLMYSFVNNKFMPPDDPLGRYGPTLDNFLRKYPKIQKKQLCPYGKKCTYGIKCKFHHPERVKQSNRSVADELRDQAKHPLTSSPAPGQSLSLAEDMAKKLVLGHDGGGGSLKKDHKSEHVKSHRSSKRSTSKKEKMSQQAPSDHSSTRHGGSQEQLDSGLGSIDSQAKDALWSDHKYGPAYGSSQRQQYCPPQGAPCCCCSHGPSCQATTPSAFQHHHPHYSLGPIRSHGSDMMPYGPPHYRGYSTYPVSMPAYSQPTDFQNGRVHGQPHPQYWSDPFGGHFPAVRSLPPGERPLWEPPQGTQLSPGGREEREVVRKKLLATFSAQLVDTAMDMFPQLMDPEMLVTEILMLQSHGRSLR